MAVWKVARMNRVSSLTGEAFPPDTEIVTALFGEEEEVGDDKVRGSGFVRKDFLASEATDELLEAAFCVWRRRTPPARPEDERRLDLGMAREFLQRLLDEGREDRAAVAMTLALLLIRKRRLNLMNQRDATAKKPAALICRWPRETATFPVPAPDVTEADAEQLQQDITRLFDTGGETASEAEEGSESAEQSAEPSDESPD